MCHLSLCGDSPSKTRATRVLRVETSLVMLGSHESSLKHLRRRDRLGMETGKSYCMELSSRSSQRP